MSCGTKSHPAHGKCSSHGRGHHGHSCSCGCGCNCGCGCGGSGHFERRYMTIAEKVAHLENYQKKLQTELQAVEEHLAKLKE